MDGAWYDLLRDDYRPEVIEVLLVAESPPDPGSGERRFFYAPVLDAKDNLYRGVVTAVYGTEPDFDLADKAANLRRLQRDGFWLVDLCDAPVNHLRGAARRQALKAAIPGLVERACQAAPGRGAVICKADLHPLLSGPLRAVGVDVLHDQPLPFPMNWSRRAFVDGFRAAIGQPSKRIRVLLADDEPDICLLLQLMLERHGDVETVSVRDGEAALQELRAGSFDVVILDGHMPTMSGYEVLREMRRDPELRDIPVFTTGSLPESYWAEQVPDRSGVTHVGLFFQRDELTAAVRMAGGISVRDAGH